MIRFERLDSTGDFIDKVGIVLFVFYTAIPICTALIFRQINETLILIMLYSFIPALYALCTVRIKMTRKVLHWTKFRYLIYETPEKRNSHPYR